MTRRKTPYRRVEALARECSEMLAWLRGPGTAAAESEFVDRLRAYKALCEAVSYMPHGPALLKKLGGLVKVRKPMHPTTTRDPDTFTADEVALLDKPVLTSRGWVVPGPLVQHVDRVRAGLMAGKLPSGDQHALIEILANAARASGKSVLGSRKDLGKLKTKVSRQRKQAITVRTKKVPPTDQSE